MFEKEKLELKKKKFKRKLVYTGGITYYRGAKQIIDTLNKFKENNYELIICGRNNLDLEKKLQYKILDKRIKIIGKIKIEKVFKLMQRASIGVLLNEKIFDYDNAVPNKLFEYLSLGLPIVASNFGIWKNIIEKYQIGELCDPNSLDEIDASIKKVFSNYSYYIDNYIKNFEDIKKKFLWNKKKNVLIQLYNNLLHKC